MIRKVIKKIRRAPVLRLRYSYRPRLRSLKSADTAVRRREKRGNGAHSGLGRKVLLLAAIGTAAFFLYDHGTFRRLPRIPYFQEMIKGLREENVDPKTLAKAALKKAQAGVKAPAKTKGLVERIQGAWAARFQKPAPEETPVAFVRLKELYAIGASGAVLRLKENVFYDMPVISGDFAEKTGPGDTLKEASLALTILTEAKENAPWLLKRTSEVVVEGKAQVRAIFSDSRLVALLGPRQVPRQLSNLSDFLGTWSKDKKGILNMIYGDIAFLTEEEKNE
jgi:hypothetical protein